MEFAKKTNNIEEKCICFAQFRYECLLCLPVRVYDKAGYWKGRDKVQLPFVDLTSDST